MLVPNYDPEEHFSSTLVRVIQSVWPMLAHSIYQEKGGRRVTWKTKSGWHEHFVPVLEKEEVCAMIVAIHKTLGK